MTVSKFGLLGGTFDPVHFGHLNLAEAALKECSLAKVFFIPSASPPHKDGRTITAFNHRVAMLEIVSKHYEHFSCSAIEGELPTPSYTIDTLRALGEFFLEESELFFIIGADAFLDIKTWKLYQEILCLVNLVIAQRKGFHKTELVDFLKNIGYTWGNNCWHGEGNQKKIFLLHEEPGNFSSTLIREKFKDGVSPDGDIPQGVIEYITNNKLYLAEVERNHFHSHER